MVKASDIKDIAPELAGESNTRVKIFIDLAECFVNDGKWGSKKDTAVTFLTAHFITLSNRKGTAGNLTSESVGSLSRSFGTTGDALELLNSTSYGQIYVELRKTLCMTPLVI